MRRVMVGVILLFTASMSGYAALSPVGEMSARAEIASRADFRFDGAGRKGGGEVPSVQVSSAGGSGLHGAARDGAVVSAQADAGSKSGLATLFVGLGIALFSMIRRMRGME